MATLSQQIGEASTTALGVVYSQARTMRLQAEMLRHFGKKHLRLLEHVVQTALKSRPFRFTFNDLLIKLLSFLSDSAQRLFFNFAIKPGYDLLITSRKLMLQAEIDRAIQNGVELVIVLGAGYDLKTLFQARSHKKVKFVEVDIDGPTRNQKLEAIRTYKNKHGKTPFNLKLKEGSQNTYSLDENLLFIAGDLENEPLAQIFQKNGINFSRPTLVIAEGLTMYLSEKAVNSLLDQLSALLSKGSKIVMSALPEMKSSFLLRWVLRSSGELYKFSKPFDEAPDYFRKHGFEAQEVFTVPTAMSLTSDTKLKQHYDTREKTVEPYYFLAKKEDAKVEYKSFKEIPEVPVSLLALKDHKDKATKRKELSKDNYHLVEKPVALVHSYNLRRRKNPTTASTPTKKLVTKPEYQVKGRKKKRCGAAP